MKLELYYRGWLKEYRHIRYDFGYTSRKIMLKHSIMAWIVMPYDLIKDMGYVVKKVCEKDLSKYEKWKKCYSCFSSKGINNWIVKISNNRICPYCNLSFVYNRTKKYTTAELDHFYNKKEYPLFALNYYNLIPVCHPCNHIKSDDDSVIVSPYAENAYDDIRIDWDFINYSNIDFNDLENNIEIKILGSEKSKKHLGIMHIEEAYGQHTDYAAELIQKIHIYNNRAARELIEDSIDIAISTHDYEQVYFGKYRYQPEENILGKMRSDFLRKYIDKY